jgi:hypothetical protein
MFFLLRIEFVKNFSPLPFNHPINAIHHANV